MEWNRQEHGYTHPQEPEPLSIRHITPKYVRAGQEIFLFGVGLAKEGHEFYIGKNLATDYKKLNVDNYAILNIPKGIQRGSYDVYAEFDISGEKNGKKEKCKTSAIVIHVEGH